MLNPTPLKASVPLTMSNSLERLSSRTRIDQDVLVRLALFDFLVKFNNYDGNLEEKEHYSYLYDHFSKPATSQFKVEPLII